MARASLSRRAMCFNVAAKWGDAYICCLAARRATFGPYRPPLDGSFRRAKNDPSQMRRPGDA